MNDDEYSSLLKFDTFGDKYWRGERLFCLR